ncbi:hypothetical protein KDX15_14760 [Burkholderia cenocepacia]|uniref:hypothetical protein n=1 Tax=Burkholderia cenocepacia TaxID=95486 RepID=UPI001B939DC6|nr:hypothetical protein [Burkholderia cenocepacia]MBR8275108.1 hypothetical protein [Burkholderia cenocepacia]
MPVRPARGFSRRIPPFLPAFLCVREIAQAARAGQYFFSFILISICNNQSDFRGMKMQCGHIRKNDVFALNDPEQNAGKCAETAWLAGCRGAVYEILRSLTKKRRTAKRVE